MKRLSTLAVALVNVIGIGALSVVGHAGAAGTCGSGRFCIWEDASYGGNAAALTVPATTCKSISGDPAFSYMNNITSAAVNNSGHTLYLFDSTNCSGAIGYTINNGQSVPNLGSFSDKLSSFMRADAYCNLHC